MHYRLIPLIRAGLILAVLIGVAGCETAGEREGFSDWEDILEPQSMLEVKALQDSLYYVTRKRRYSDHIRQEYWRWSNGELFAEEAYPGTYFSRNFDDPGLLVEHGAAFNRLKKLGVAVGERDVRTAVDSRNRRVPFAVKASDSGKTLCFIAARATRTVRGGDRPVTINSIGGWVVLYRCERGLSEGDVEPFTAEGLKLIDHIEPRL